MAKLTAKEYETKVLELAKRGLTSEKIGQELKKEKIYSKDNKKIGRILKENKLFKSPDMENLKTRVEKLEKHAKMHIQDQTYRRALNIKAAKLRKLGMISKI